MSGFFLKSGRAAVFRYSTLCYYPLICGTKNANNVRTPLMHSKKAALLLISGETLHVHVRTLSSGDHGFLVTQGYVCYVILAIQYRNRNWSHSSIALHLRTVGLADDTMQHVAQQHYVNQHNYICTFTTGLMVHLAFC